MSSVQTSGAGPATDPQWYASADPQATAEALAQDFAERFGRAPAGVWAAPGRVNLIGEHVDYNGGRCMPFALPHRTFAALAPRTDGLVAVASRQDPATATVPLADLGPGCAQGWTGYALGVPWGLAEQGLPVGGFDVLVDGHVPLGSGLSSSAALECAVAVALDEVFGLGLAGDDAGRRQLAAACVRAENEVAGAPTGGMDQAASLRSAAGAVLLLDCTDFSARTIPFDLAAADLALLVMDTRAHHTLVDGQYGSRREVCAQAARRLGVTALAEINDADSALARLDAPVRPLIRHVLTELQRVDRAADLLEQAPGAALAGRAGELGALMDASHESLAGDYQVSCAELDLACTAARAAGALGARMTGGGFGGSAIALVAREQAPAAAQAVAEAFAEHSFTPPRFLLATPSAAAGRVPPTG